MTSRATLRVIEAVAHHFFLEPEQVLSRDRHSSIAIARQVAMYVLREHQRPRPSFPELEREFGRDHTTIIHAVRRVPGYAVADEHVCNAIEVGRLALEAVTTDEKIDRLQKLRRRETLLAELQKCEAELVLDYEATRIGAAE